MGVMHAYTGQLLPVGGADAAADDLTVAVDRSVFRLLSSEAASQAAVNTGHSRSYNQNNEVFQKLPVQGDTSR